MTIGLCLDGESQSYDLSVDGEWVRHGVEFAARVESLQRLVFRTGAWRGDVRGWILDREPATQGLYIEDLGGAGDKVPLSIFLIDDVKTGSNE